MFLLLFWADFLKIMTFGPHVTNVLPVYCISFYDVHGSDGWSDSKQWINFPGLPFDNSVHALMTILQVWYQTQLPVMLWSWKFLKNVPSAKLLMISAKIVFNLWNVNKSYDKSHDAVCCFPFTRSFMCLSKLQSIFGIQKSLRQIG